MAITTSVTARVLGSGNSGLPLSSRVLTKLIQVKKNCHVRSSENE